jgi:hypothetical protein
VLGSVRASYGEGIVATLSRELVTEFGRGFHVAQYLTKLPSLQVLRRKLQDALVAAKLRFDPTETL